ncbi:hypothetical protein QBC44DRAFT_246595 [Cladorrhinum sp. PSN332]|nr:hypothetical protein QBC44DRAFT_246595 [Cladorrhinum sp. PSN332]
MTQITPRQRESRPYTYSGPSRSPSTPEFLSRQPPESNDSQPTKPSSPSSTNTNSAPSSSSTTPPRILPRQLSSLFLIVLLYTAATPFNPISWLTGSILLSGTYFFDRLLAGILLFCAFYFQWRIASLRSDTVISIPLLGGDAQFIRNGRIERSGAAGVEVWRWRVNEYWVFAAIEAAALVAAEFGGNEGLRRLLVAGTVLALWVLGWSVTPGSTRRWAWEQIKVFLWVLVLDEVRRVGMGIVGGMGGGNRRRRW